MSWIQRMNRLLEILCLQSIDGLGPNRIMRLIHSFQNKKSVLDATFEELSRIENINHVLAKKIIDFKDTSFAEKQLQHAKNGNIQLISYWDSDYPDSLKAIYDPPVLLFAKGDSRLLKSDGIAIVGTRRASSYGKSIAEKLARELSEMGLTVFSGMAKGIDTYAHRGALLGKGKTVAVLGCGVNVVYPAVNRELYQKIISDGLVVSEFPINTEPSPPFFPRRNRIVSGLSAGTVVVEAGEKSGALITAYLALEQNKEVFAIPGPINSVGSSGPHRLLREGAKLVEDVSDILAELKQFSNLSQKKKEDPVLSGSEKILWNLLSQEPMHIDLLSEKAEMSMSDTLATLLTLELKQSVQQLSGMMYVRL